MDLATHRLIEALHAASAPYVLAVTGGGASEAAQLLEVPGASRTILEVIVPYHGNALNSFLGRVPGQSCSVETARSLAACARRRAGELLPRLPVLGIACTASLATDRPKHGDHRFHIAIETSEKTVDYSVVLTKEARERAAEEAVVDATLLNALAEAQGIDARIAIPLLPGEEMKVQRSPRGDLLSALFRGERSSVCLEIDGGQRGILETPRLVVPGSFNPLHAGHRRLAEVAGQIVGAPPAFELSITNVDKPPLLPEEVEHRLRQFTWIAPLWLTRASTFLEKAELFPGTTFVVGSDTAIRIVAPSYYGNREESMTAALARIRNLGCRFLVAGRTDAAGNFVACEQLDLPADLFGGIPESAFRADISSTQLRSASNR